MTDWHALHLGGAACEALAEGTAARVFAAFERSCYIETSLGVACVGDARIGLGPLNVVVSTLDSVPRVGARVRVHIHNARVWKPPQGMRGTAAGLPARQLSLWRRRRPADSLAAMVDAPELLAPRTRRAAQAFLDWLSIGATGAAPRSAAGLIGLGPGLTPAGDDFIGGALIALRFARRATAADRVAAWALARSVRTNRISAAHLACAAQGEGHEALHRFLQALVPHGPGFSAALQTLDRIGHSSGWDAAAGALLALTPASG